MFKGVGDENNKGKITHPIHSHSKIKINLDTNTVVDPLTNGINFFSSKTQRSNTEDMFKLHTLSRRFRFKLLIRTKKKECVRPQLTKSSFPDL
jgi:hypothetical protein